MKELEHNGKSGPPDAPKNVVTEPSGEIFRTVNLASSTTYAVPVESNATLEGMLKLAATPIPSADPALTKRPAEFESKLPASVETHCIGTDAPSADVPTCGKAVAVALEDAVAVAVTLLELEPEPESVAAADLVAASEPIRVVVGEPEAVALSDAKGEADAVGLDELEAEGVGEVVVVREVVEEAERVAVAAADLEAVTELVAELVALAEL